MVIWVCGLSGSGKTTLCNVLWQLLKEPLPELVLLDGDAIRATFGHDLGYSKQDRVVQIKRIQNIAKLLSEQHLVVIVAALYSSPELLDWNRCNLSDYFEVYLEVSWDTIRNRDPKGLYAGASSGKITNMVGMDIPWHVPESPDLILNNDGAQNAEALARRIVDSVPRLSRAVGASWA